MNRRKFLQTASLLAAGTIIPIGINGWVSRSFAQSDNRQRLIVILLRGGVDGLNVVVPYQDPIYYQSRPTIAIPKLNQDQGVLYLNNTFGLHPALKPLMSLWKQENLAFVHACGSRNETRSHFDAQLYMESGTPGIKSTTEGWMNRLLATLPQGRPTQAVNRGETIPLILRGSMTVANLPPARNANHRLPVDRPYINAAFDRLYQGNDAISHTYRQGREAREIVLAELQKEMNAADGGAPSTINFVKDCRNLARLMVGDAKTQLAFMDLGSWDTHVNQGGSSGNLSNNLKKLGAGLATLAKDLGSLFNQTTIVVLSEFGRTVRENGNGGTDHGHGNVMWLLGGRIRGGKVYGQWTGLEDEQLYQGRDLEVTTDFRDIVMSVLQQHMGLNNSQMAQVFPDYSAQQRLDIYQ